MRPDGFFFKDILGFKPLIETASYAIYEKDHLTVHILPAGEHIGQMEFYLEVADGLRIWNEMDHQVEHLKHQGPEDQTYGMREVHIEVSFTKALLYIGQYI